MHVCVPLQLLVRFSTNLFLCSLFCLLLYYLIYYFKAKAGAKKRDVVYNITGQDGEDSAYYLTVGGFDR